MSDWHDHQRERKISFRKLLEEQANKVNPRRTNLTKQEQKRLDKLQGIAARLERGEHVQNRQLKIWLTEDEYASIEAEWQEQLALREELKDKPSELQRYEEKLKQATFYYNRADSYDSKGKKSTAKKLYDKSESLCEDALEILEELLYVDPSLRIWFDREIHFEFGSDIGAELESLPRVVTSRSKEKLSTHIALESKTGVKLRVVDRAIYSIGRD